MKLGLLMTTMVCLRILLTVQTAEARQVVAGAIPDEVGRLKLGALGRLPATNHLRVSIGFSVRDRDGLSRLLDDIYQPGSANYRHYLTPQEFAERFGVAETDYQAAVNFAKANGLTVARTHVNRLVLVVEGNVPAIEQAFHVKMCRYWHPEENREFYAPDRNPQLDLAVPVLQIDGLNNYALPAAMASGPQPKDGSGPAGEFAGVDYRTAYAPGVAETGAGQIVGVVEFEGYYKADIANYETQYNLPSVPLINVGVDGSTFSPNTNGEAPGDIQMVISMATNLAAVVVFEAHGEASMATWNDMLSLMASSNQIKQFTCSWRLTSGATNPVGDQLFQELGVQGQSFFKASGDGDAYMVNPIPWPNDNPYVTLVGGTELTMSGTGKAYASEQVWNAGLKNKSWGGNGAENYWGSGGGVSPTYSLPNYQRGISMALNGGSTVMRNLPDVSIVASQINFYYADGASDVFNGTSFAAPLWAGFMALVNQRAASLGLPSVGFANPALYAIGSSGNYPKAFHDITVGTNGWPGSPMNYAAVTGYDLCTGWGSPNGTNLIMALIDELSSPLYAPRFIFEKMSGNTLTLQSAYGTPGAAYTLLVATNPALPGSLWQTNSSGHFNEAGISTNQVQINHSNRSQFFRIRSP